MFVSQENWEDCKKYFQDCWVKFKEEGDNKIWYITEVKPKHILAKGVDGEVIGVDLSEGYTIDYVLPKKTTFQCGEHAYHLSRIPARQWKKGMNKQNTSFALLPAENGWLNTALDPSLIHGFINKPSYYPFHNAVKEFTTSNHLQSAALASRVAVTRKGKVYIDTIPVAHFDFDKNLLAVKKIFKQELETLCPNVDIRVLK